MSDIREELEEYFGTPSDKEISIVLVCFVGLFLCGATSGLLYALMCSLPY